MDATETAYGNDLVLLCARVFLVALFIVFGWDKLFHFQTTVNAMTQRGLPLPSVAAAMAVGAELPLCVLLAVGIWTRPIALLLAAYTLATAFIGHRFWEFDGAARSANAINFYKNVSIIGGFLLLYVTGPGRYSLAAYQRPKRYEAAIS